MVFQCYTVGMTHTESHDLDTNDTNDDVHGDLVDKDTVPVDGAEHTAPEIGHPLDSVRADSALESLEVSLAESENQQDNWDAELQMLHDIHAATLKSARLDLIMASILFFASSLLFSLLTDAYSIITYAFLGLGFIVFLMGVVNMWQLPKLHDTIASVEKILDRIKHEYNEDIKSYSQMIE